MMRYSFSLESVNMLTSGPNFIYKQSKRFWQDYFKYVAAVGFDAVELPFNPFSSDPMAFETGRCGIPCSAAAINSKYGSPAKFREFLSSVGVRDISGIHMSANDAMLEAVAVGEPETKYFALLNRMTEMALEHAAGLGAEELNISPSPETGWILSVFPGDEAQFKSQSISVLKQACEKAKGCGVKVNFKTEFWGLFGRGDAAELTAAIPDAGLCPDTAHMFIAGLPVRESIKAWGCKVRSVRLGDTAFSDEFKNYRRINAELPVDGPQKVFCDLGDGLTDAPAVISTLKAMGYDGWVVCEQKKMLDVYRGLLKLGWYVGHVLKSGV